VWANGGYATKHAFGVYAAHPPAAGFRHDTPQEAVDALPRRELASIDDAAGATVTVEAYTVMHARDGAPERAILSALLPDGRRAWGTSEDGGICVAMCDGEWVGRSVTLAADGSFEPA
jgi:acetyl-CoA C-acetyltransferase